MAEFEQFFDAGVGAVLLAVGLAIAIIGRGRAVHSVLAFMLLWRGVENVFQGLRVYEWSRAWQAADHVMDMGLVTTAFVFAGAFIATYGSRRFRWAAWTMFGGGVAYAAYMLIPGWAFEFGSEQLVEFDYWQHLPRDLWDLWRVIAGASVVVVAMASQRETVRRSGVLVGAGMMLFAWAQQLNGTWFAPACSIPLVPACLEAPRELFRSAWVETIVAWTVMPAILIQFWRLGGPARRLAVGLLIVTGIEIANFTAVALLLLSEVPIEKAADILNISLVRSVWTLMQPVLIAYGMLRYEVLGLDLRFQTTVRAGTLLAFFVGTFVLASQIGGAFIEDQTGSSLVGAIATASLLLIVVPLKRFADRAGRAAAPHAKPLSGTDDQEREAIYRDQLEFAWADGGISKTERIRLENLRSRLGLGGDAALRIEALVVAS